MWCSSACVSHVSTCVVCCFSGTCWRDDSLSFEHCSAHFLSWHTVNKHCCCVWEMEFPQRLTKHLMKLEAQTFHYSILCTFAFNNYILHPRSLNSSQKWITVVLFSQNIVFPRQPQYFPKQLYLLATCCPSTLGPFSSTLIERGSFKLPLKIIKIVSCYWILMP